MVVVTSKTRVASNNNRHKGKDNVVLVFLVPVAAAAVEVQAVVVTRMSKLPTPLRGKDMVAPVAIEAT